MSKIPKEIKELFEKRGPELYTLLVRLVLNEEIAEDIMQDLFIKLASIKDLGRIRDLMAYAKRTAVNMAFDFKSKGKREYSLDNFSEP